MSMLRGQNRTPDREGPMTKRIHVSTEEEPSPDLTNVSAQSSVLSPILAGRDGGSLTQTAAAIRITKFKTGGLIQVRGRREGTDWSATSGTRGQRSQIRSRGSRGLL